MTTKERSAEYYKKNKTKIDEKNKTWANEHKELLKERNAKRYLDNKAAVLQRSKDRYAKNSELIKKQSAARYQKNRVKNHLKLLLAGAKRRAKIQGMIFDLIEADIHIPEHCPILNIPLCQGNRNNPNSPSIDRVDNTKGYIKTNIQIISNRANSLKRDANFEELVKLGEWAKSKL